MSDPFQPCEKEHRVSMKALEIFAETGYPVIISTKGKLITDDEYLNVLKRCNAVVQVSMIAPRYDTLEPGCPTYQERLEMLKKLAPNCKRLIVRIQPYTTDVLREVLDNIPRIADAGAYGIIVEGMKSVKGVKGMVKIAGDFCYPYEVLQSHFEMVRDKAHEFGLAFFSGENRLRSMGDSLTCCGCEGVEGFKTNHYNLNHIMNGDKVEPTEKMKEVGTAYPFKAMNQTTVFWNRLKEESFAAKMLDEKTVSAMKPALLKTKEKPCKKS